MADTKNKKVSIEVEVKTDKAKKQLDDFAKSVQSLKNKINLNVDIKTQGVNKTLNELQKNSEKVSRQMAQSFAGSFDQTAKKVKNVGKEIEKTLSKLSKEGKSIGAKFGKEFANAAVKAIKASMSLFKSATKLIIKGMVATIKACLPLIQGGIRYLSNGITKALNGIATSAKKIISGITNSLTNALKRTVEFTVNANVNTNTQGDDSGNSGAGKSLLNAGLMAASLKTITQAAAKNSLPKETGNVVAAFASKMVDAGQKVVTFGKFAYQAYVLISSNWPKIVETFKSISTAIKPYLEEGLKLATDAAKSVLTKGLDLAAKAFKTGIDKMMKSDNSFIRRLGEVINTISNKFMGLDKKTNAFRERIEEATEKVKAFAHEIGLATTGKELKGLFTILVDSVKKVGKAFQPYLMDALKAIVNLFNKVISAVGSVVKIFANLLSILSPLLSVVKVAADRLASLANLFGAVAELLNYFIEKVANVLKKVVELILKPFNKFDEILTGGINKLADGIRKLPDIFDKLGSAAKRLTSTFMDKVKDFFGIGKKEEEKPKVASAFAEGNEFDKVKNKVETLAPQDWDKFDRVVSDISGLSFRVNEEKDTKNIEDRYSNKLAKYFDGSGSFKDILSAFENGGKSSIESIVKGSSSLTSGLNPYSQRKVQEDATKALIQGIEAYVNILEKSGVSVEKFKARLDEANAKKAQGNTQTTQEAQTESTETKQPKKFVLKRDKKEEVDVDVNINTDDLKEKLSGIKVDKVEFEEVKIPEVKIDSSDIKVEGKPVEFDLETSESSDNSLKGKITNIHEAIQAYAKFENSVNTVLHPVKTLRQELLKKITFRTLEDLGKQASKAKDDFNKLRESVAAFKAMEPGAEKKAASLKILGDAAKLAVDKLKITLKANTVGKLIEKMQGPADKATKKLANKVPGGKDNINLFKGALGKLALLFGGAGLFGMTKEATTQAIKYESAIMQLNNRLGQSAALMDKFAAGKGLDLGLSKSNIAEYGNIFSIYVSKFEADANKATETTIGLLEAASKTAQATGTDMTTVMDSFRSALTGSSEAVDQYGLNMKIANLELSESFKQIANGATKWDELTQAQQQQVIAMEMISQTNKNFGDGVKNSNSILLKFQAVLANVKLALGNTFKVIMTAVLPPLTALMQTLEVVLNKVTQFVTALLSLMGVQVDFSNSLGNMGSVTNGIGDASSSVDDIASSADNATDSAKKLKGELAGFDEINKITMSEETGSGEGLNSGGINAGEIQLDTSNADNKVQEFANKAKEVLQSIMDAFKSGWDQNVPYIQKSLENLKLAFEHVKEASKDLFKGIWENGGQQLVTNIGALCSAVTGMAIDMAGQLAESLAQVLEHLNPANNEAMQYFIDSLNGMTKAAEEFVLSMGEHFASWREHGLQDFFNNIADISTALAGLAADLTGQILTALDTFFDHIDPANNPRTQKFLEALNYMAQAVEDFILSAGGWFSKFMESGGQAFLNNLGDIALAIGQLAATLVGDIINAIKNFMNSWVGEALITAVAKALEFLSGIVEGVVGFLADHTGVVETFLGVWGVYKGGSKVIEWANNLAVFIGGVKDLAIAVGSGVIAKLKTLFDLFKTSGLSSTISGIASSIGTLVKNIALSTAELIKNIAQWALQKAAMVAGKVATVAMQGAQAALNLVMTANPIGLVITAIAALVAAFVLAYNKCEWFREGVHKVLNWLKDAWSKYVEWFKGNCTKMWDGIKGVFDKIKNIFGSIKDVAKTAFSGLLDIITNPFKTAYNVVKGVVDKFKNIFNFKWSLPKIKLPHFSIKPTGWELGDLLKGSIPRLGIDWYSNGGIFNERALIGVGDANHGYGNKPEAVVPLDQMYKNINEIVKNQVNTALAQTHQAQGNTTIVLRVNDVDLAKTVVRSINDLQRSTGEVWLDI